MNATRYLKVVQWARDRYTEDGHLVYSVGNVVTKYVRIEKAAWRKYMRQV